MFRFLIFAILIVAVAVVLAPRIIPAVSWVLAFLSLLMLADLVRGEIRKHFGNRRSA